MATFSKLLGLAGSAAVFAGMAFGQATCTAGAVSTNIIRAEGTTELLAPVTVTCGTGGAAGLVNLSVFVSPALPVTSKVLDSGTGKTEAVATIGGTSVNGTVNGSTLNFTGVSAPAGAFTVTIANIRVNASSLSVGTGVPPNINATVFISGATGTVTPIALTYNNVAFAQNGLAAAKSYKTPSGGTFPNFTVSTTGTTNFVICQAINPKANGNASIAFLAQVNENFPAAFKTQTDEASTSAQAIGSVNNTPNSGTRIKLAFSNVPANVSLYVPTSTASTLGGGQIQLTSSESGAFSAVTAGTGSNLGGLALAQVSLSSGAGVAVFEVTKDDLNALDQYNIPVYVVTTANSVVASATPISTVVSLAPIGSTNIPNFASTSSSTTLTGSTFSACTTSLLFPFVTNQLGFDTGLAIANTSTDPFGTNGATPQAGTCTLNFYGAGAPNPNNVTTPNIPSGTVFTQVLSGVAAGFQGYMIAQCSFQYAHGFAFITDGVGANGGLSQGYLAGVIPDVNQVGGRPANPSSSAGPGTGETLGN